MRWEYAAMADGVMILNAQPKKRNPTISLFWSWYGKARKKTFNNFQLDLSLVFRRIIAGKLNVTLPRAVRWSGILDGTFLIGRF